MSVHHLPKLAPAWGSPALPSPTMIDTLLNAYYSEIYPLEPLLPLSYLATLRPLVDQDIGAHAVVMALLAYTMARMATTPAHRSLPGWTGLNADQTLYRDAIHLYNRHAGWNTGGLLRSLASFLVHRASVELGENRNAWYFLRETATLMLDGDDPSPLHPEEELSQLWSRLYWEVFVIERIYALNHHAPLSLYIQGDLIPQAGAEADVTAVNGLMYRVNLFRTVDDLFTGMWNKTSIVWSPDWLVHFHEQIAAGLPVNLSCSDVQKAGLYLDQQWLQAMVWHLSGSFVALTEGPTHLNILKPVQILRKLLERIDRLPFSIVTKHGRDALVKMFDIADTVADMQELSGSLPFEEEQALICDWDKLSCMISVIDPNVQFRRRFQGRCVPERLPGCQDGKRERRMLMRPISLGLCIDSPVRAVGHHEAKQL